VLVSLGGKLLVVVEAKEEEKKVPKHTDQCRLGFYEECISECLLNTFDFPHPFCWKTIAKAILDEIISSLGRAVGLLIDVLYNGIFLLLDFI